MKKLSSFKKNKIDLKSIHGGKDGEYIPPPGHTEGVIKDKPGGVVVDTYTDNMWGDDVPCGI